MAVENEELPKEPAEVRGADGDAAEERRDRRRRRGLLVWLLLAIVAVTAMWLIRQYSDFGKAPEQASASKGDSVVRSTVPDVTGMSRANATRDLEAAGFYVEVDASFDSAADPDTVISQDPTAGDRAISGSTVFVTVAQALPDGGGDATGEDDTDTLGKVPNVVGKTQAAAVQTLADAGFPVNIKGVYSSTVPLGSVVSQATPVTGPSGEVRIPLLISLGSEPLKGAVPYVIGLSRAEAEAKIRESGFDPRPTYQPKGDSIGKVYEQSPAPGAKAPANRLVFMLIGVDPLGN